MTNTNHLTTSPNEPTLLSKRMLLGAAIALVVTLTFVLPVKHPNPAWGKLWIIKPLMITPLAGACGGLFSYFMHRWGYQGGWKKIAAIVVSILGYLIALWMGIVLGLNGTLWN